MEKVYFVTKSKQKYEEAKAYLEGTVQLEYVNKPLPKLQSTETDNLVEDKAKTAFKMLKRPVLVEHTSICIEAFNQLEGLDTNYFCKTFGYDNIVKYCDDRKNHVAYVESVFCLCDGKQYYKGSGEDEGKIICFKDIKKDLYDGFGWDTIFIPKEDNKNNITYEELKCENPGRRTMRIKALEMLKEDYKKRREDTGWADVYAEQEKELDELAELISDGKVMLFAGAGVSASLGFPDWSTLIGKLGKNAGYHKDLFQCHGDYMMLAEYARIMESRSGDKSVYDILKDIFQVTDEIRAKFDNQDESSVYHKLLELNFPVIYTTNFDCLLEEFYKRKGRRCHVVRRESDMTDGSGVTDGDIRIMKFHGDLVNISESVDGQDPVVLSESQYYERMDFQSVLDKSFMEDLNKYNVLFLGYSLSDINVKMLMYLFRRKQKGNQEAKKAYIYTATPNLIQREVFRKNGIISFTGAETDKEKGTLRFLDSLIERQHRVEGEPAD